MSEDTKDDAKDDAKDDNKEDTTDDTKEDALEEEQEPMDTSTAAAPESEEVRHQPMFTSCKTLFFKEESAAPEKEQVEAEPEKKEKEKSVEPEPPKDEVRENEACDAFPHFMF